MAKLGYSYSGVTTNRGPSPRLWKQCPWEDIKKYMIGKIIVDDDFHNAPNLSADADDDKYASYIDTSDTIKLLADEPNGVLAFTTDNTDNDEAWIQAGGNAGGTAVISDTAGSDFALWFEARVKVGAITDSLHNFFVGLAEEGRAAGDTITDGGALGDFDFIGFRALEADGDEVNFIYQKATQTLVQKIDALHVLVADTFVKLGFFYNPWAPKHRRISIFVNGVEQSTYVTAANIATATFPDGEEMAPLAGAKNGTTTGIEFAMDWWRCVQMSETGDFSFRSH